MLLQNKCFETLSELRCVPFPDHITDYIKLNNKNAIVGGEYITLWAGCAMTVL
jgi:hypothetical protein